MGAAFPNAAPTLCTWAGQGARSSLFWAAARERIRGLRGRLTWAAQVTDDVKAVMTDPAQLRLRDYRPVPSLSTPSHRVERARAPVIDAHTHLGRWTTGGTWAVPDTTRLAELMDSCNIAAAVNLDGRWGAELEANLDRYDRPYPGRCNAEDIAWIARMLDSYPNLTIDIAARIAELGRQPRRTRALLLRHPDRVLFGTDLIPPQRETYEIYFRFLETEDEYFSYSPSDPPGAGASPPSTCPRRYCGSSTQKMPGG